MEGGEMREELVDVFEAILILIVIIFAFVGFKEIFF